MKTRTQRIAAGAAAAVGIVLGAAGVSAAATSTPAPAHKPAVQTPATKTAEVPDASEPKESGSEKAEAGGTDGDNVQEGPGDTADGGPEVPDANEAPEASGK